MKIFKLLGVNFALAMLLAACGGGPNNTLTAPSSGVVQYTTPTSIVATTNSTSVLSDGSTSATITVLALDANHVLLTNSQISFAASSGTDGDRQLGELHYRHSNCWQADVYSRCADYSRSPAADRCCCEFGIRYSSYIVGRYNGCKAHGVRERREWEFVAQHRGSV